MTPAWASLRATVVFDITSCGGQSFSLGFHRLTAAAGEAVHAFGCFAGWRAPWKIPGRR